MKNKKKDIICNLIFVIVYVLIFILITKGKYIFGSTTDFSDQHYLIPEYFRNLFYKNFDLFPDFAFNLGGGINIYYLSYYGLLSPLILISYLLPNVNMLYYIIISTSLAVLSATSLFYFFLKKHNHSILSSFLCSLMFMCATPIIFHAHRHIMFINYMPFLIMGFFGIDKYIEKKKSGLLILSNALMIYTSYYFSVSGLIVLFIYAFYRYYSKHITIKEIIKNMLKLSLRFIISVLIASILLLPTIYTLLNGRTDSVSTINILELLKPHMYLLYDKYSMGLTLISLISLIYAILKSKKEDKFLSIILLLISIFPIFNFILNGTLYINAKSLIPFIPLVLYLTCKFLDKIFNIKIIKTLLPIYIIISSTCITFIVSSKDKLMDTNNLTNNTEYKNIINNITSKDNLYRINNSYLGKSYINKVSNIYEYKTTVYSSTYNKLYDNLYKNIFGNPLPYRNKFMLSSSNNLLFQIYMGEKYIITKDELPSIYKKIYKDNKINYYELDSVFPIGYATNKIINKDEFNKLTYPNNVINLLGNIVTNKETNTNIKELKETSINLNLISKENMEYEKKDYGYYIDAKKNALVNLKINDDLKGKILLLRFDILKNVSCNNKDLTITINNIKNKLTCSSWKYYNENTTFDYVLLDGETLNIAFEKGKYEIGNIKTYILDYEEINKINNTIDSFIIDKNKTKGDKIVGNIDVKEKSIFTLSIPYDKGFKIKVDSKEKPYYEVNEGFIGIDIDKGKHNIEIVYEAPYKKIGIIFTVIGLVLSAIIIISERSGIVEKNKYNSSML